MSSNNEQGMVSTCKHDEQQEDARQNLPRNQDQSQHSIENLLQASSILAMGTSEHTFSENYSLGSSEEDIYCFSSSCGSTTDGYESSDFGDDACSFSTYSTVRDDDDGEVFFNNLSSAHNKLDPDQKQVRFNETVVIREYAVTIGMAVNALQKDTTRCALTLDWPYRTYTVSLAKLECKLLDRSLFFSSNRRGAQRLSLVERRRKVGRVQGWSSNQVQDLEYSRLVQQIDEALTICADNNNGGLLPGMLDEEEGHWQQGHEDYESYQNLEIFE